jgi:hypothetical protein
VNKLIGVLMVVALAGCGGPSDSSPTPSAATSSAHVEPDIHKAAFSCGLLNSRYASTGDAGYTITLEGRPDGEYTGLRPEQIACVLTALAVPDSVVSEMDGTRAIDGTRKASWDKFSATWTYHPDHGLRIVLTESK